MLHTATSGVMVMAMAGMCVFAGAREGELREAAIRGDTDAVTELVTSGHVQNIDAPNDLGWTALHLAAVRIWPASCDLRACALLLV